MSAPDTQLDLVTGAFSNSGSYIARALIDAGRSVRTLTFHPDRAHPLRSVVEALPYRFDDPVQLARSLDGVTTLYNTYWVRFERGGTRFADAVSNSRALFYAARRAGVSRIVHVSVTNASIASTLGYFRGKALVERSLAEVGVPYAIVRPAWIFGGEHEVLANDIAWVLRRFPVFVLPGDGRYPVQPVHIEDLARICVEAGSAEGDVVRDAAGPETMTFEELVGAVRQAVGARARIVHVPPAAMQAAARALGQLTRDVVLTRGEIAGLTSGLLVSEREPLGHIAFTRWLAENGDSLGGAYANELDRHFARTTDEARPLGSPLRLARQS
ncbi:MAG: SDR family oxidoreductase [Solirubrobacteraceae bacterium]